MKLTIEFVHLRQSVSSVLHHFAKADRLMTLGLMMFISHTPIYRPTDSILSITPIFPTLPIVHLAVWILKPPFIKLYFIFLWFWIWNRKILFQAIHVSSSTVGSVIIFFPALQIIITTSRQVVEFFEALDIFFTILSWKAESFSPTILIILCAGSSVIVRNTIIT